jgi:predicted RNA-binding Zn-ribbon protein involved in translation (DUF1610 family)
LSIECTQCGAELSPHKDEVFYNCPYCSSTLYIQRGRSLQHYFVSARVGRKDTRSILATWLGGSELNEEINIVSAEHFFFPFWYFQFGGEENHLTPANTSEVEEISAIKLPPVNLLPFETDKIGGVRVVQPQFLHDISLEKTVETTGSSKESLVSSSLIHLPLWEIAYTYGKDPSIYTAVVEGTGGAVYANVMPAPPLRSLRAAYLTLGYGSLALFVLVGFAAPNFWWRLGLYAFLVPLVFIIGRKVIEKYG